MQVTITIPDDLAAEAQARGLQLNQHLLELLAQELAEERQVQAAAADLPAPATPPRRSGPRDMDAFFEAMARYSDEIPALPDEAFTRESFYQDHD